jgi:hypothetical protein
LFLWLMFQVFSNIYQSPDSLIRFLRGMHCFASLSARWSHL